MHPAFAPSDPDADQVSRFYDDFAGDYAAAVTDWNLAVQRQARSLGTVIADRVGDRSRVLDCAAGIGTQALGLAARGFEVTASDMSVGALAQARAEADRRGLTLAWAVGDMRDLSPDLGEFDAVLCCDNSLPHVAEPDLPRALASMRARLRDGGLLLLSLRDYAQHRTAAPTVTAPQRSIAVDGTETVGLQTWDWVDLRTYVATQLLLRRRPEAPWSARVVGSVTMTAYSRGEVLDQVARAGFVDGEWLSPDRTGYHQHVLLAHRA